MQGKIYEDVFEVMETIQHNFSVRKSEKFTPMAMPDGTARLVPDNQSPFLFRGQTQYHAQCTPTLYRNNPSEIDIFLARLQTVEFEMVLRYHPVVTEFIEDDCHVPFLDLAQHYGIKTELLDFTSNYWIAAFFAVCEYDISNDSYKPISTSDIKCGVIYAAPFFVFEHLGTLDCVGLQPFLRPGLQKAYSYKWSKEDSFPAMKMLFKHSKSASEKIYERFKGGSLIVPTEPIYTKAVEITTSHKLSYIAFQKVINRYHQFNKGEAYYIKELERKNINVVDEQPHKFSNEQIKLFSQQWHSEGRREYTKQIGSCRIEVRL